MRANERVHRMITSWVHTHAHTHDAHNPLGSSSLLISPEPAGATRATFKLDALYAPTHHTRARVALLLPRAMCAMSASGEMRNDTQDPQQLPREHRDFNVFNMHAHIHFANDVCAHI